MFLEKHAQSLSDKNQPLAHQCVQLEVGYCSPSRTGVSPAGFSPREVSGAPSSPNANH